MATKASQIQFEKFNFCSNLAEDVYHPSDSPASYECWCFDAISDDRRDAVAVIFSDNFIFSPRYNKAQSSKLKVQSSSQSEIEKFPAVVFSFYRDGKPLYRAINEFSGKDFSARTDFPSCKIGDSFFSFEATPYGVRYILDINVNLQGNQRLTAALEWLIIERDFSSTLNSCDSQKSHYWNLAAPRADVTGRIEVVENDGKQIDKIQFRGTGYHDHNKDERWLPVTVSEWQRGRAHFADATAVFYRYEEIGDEAPLTRLFIIRENRFDFHETAFSASLFRRNRFGVKYPQNLEFLTAQNISLSIKQTRIIDASFFYLRFLSEMTLDFGDGETRETIGITEHLAPRALRRRWLDWLIDMRISRNKRGAFLP